MKNQILGLLKEELTGLGAIHTAQEICGQPNLWKKTWKLVDDNQEAIQKFIRKIFSKNNLQVILTGAGTSAYIGEVLEGPFQRNTGQLTRAIPTTSIVTHPELYLMKDRPTLLISFARSGNSPESCKAVELAKNYCNDIYNLIITCNESGNLAKSNLSENDFVFLLPSEADDQSLAMTGSFSSMLLTGLLISRINNLAGLEKQVSLLSKYGQNVILNYASKIREIANIDFSRAVFLGSGIFSGIAQESHLKLQELTDGKIICKHDTFLGFRHGPKAVIQEDTLLAYIFSNDNYSQKYEIDLAASVNAGRKGRIQIAIMEHDIECLNVDYKIIFSEVNESISEEFLTVVSILPGQILGFYKSLNLKLKPDSPSESGIITRVVKGVKLYDYNPKVGGEE